MYSLHSGCFSSNRSVASLMGRPASCISFHSIVQIFSKKCFFFSLSSNIVSNTYSGFQSINTFPRSNMNVVIFMVQMYGSWWMTDGGGWLVVDRCSLADGRWQMTVDG